MLMKAEDINTNSGFTVTQLTSCLVCHKCLSKSTFFYKIKTFNKSIVCLHVPGHIPRAHTPVL